MRRVKIPKVRIKNVKGRKSPWCVYYYLKSKPQYVGYFPSEAKAKVARNEAQAEINADTPDLNMEYPYRFRDLKDDFLRYQIQIGNSPHTYRFYEEKLNWLSDRLGSKRMQRLERHHVRQAIKAAGNGPTWEAMMLRALSAMMNWGHSEDPPMSPPSFTRWINLKNPRESRHKNFFTVEEVQLLMDRVRGTDRQLAMALKFFAGFRTAEIDRMRSDMISVDERRIYVPDTVGKTAGLMEDLPEAFWRWVPKKMPKPSVLKGKSVHVIHNMKRYLDMDQAKGATSRRTFATYAANLYGCERTRRWMRHDDKLTTMERNYMGCVAYRDGKPYLASKENAERYFAI